MAEYSTINVSKETKEEFDKQRSLPQGIVTADEYLRYLLKKKE